MACSRDLGDSTNAMDEEHRRAVPLRDVELHRVIQPAHACSLKLRLVGREGLCSMLTCVIAHLLLQTDKMNRLTPPTSWLQREEDGLLLPAATFESFGSARSAGPRRWCYRRRDS